MFIFLFVCEDTSFEGQYGATGCLIVYKELDGHTKLTGPAINRDSNLGTVKVHHVYMWQIL